MKWEYGEETAFDFAPPGVIIACEGNFQYGNATLSHYDPMTGEVENEVFLRANGMKLGDVAESVSVDGDRAWVVVNNSHVVFAVDTHTFRETGRITGLPSPRYIHIVAPDKAYITQLWSNTIIIADPSRYVVTGAITVPGMEAATGSTEQIVESGGYVYVACWSYQDRILKIDPATDQIVSELKVGLQPRSIVSDCHGRLWVLCDGGYPGSPAGNEPPCLQCIDTEKFEITDEFTFSPSSTPTGLCTDGNGERLYWIDRDVWEMPVDNPFIPAAPLIAGRNTLYYSLGVDPQSGEIYVADAIDYQQPAVIYRYSSDGRISGEFRVGVNPSSFAWITK